MQLFGLHKNIYRLADYSLRQENLSEKAKISKKLFGDWELLKRRGVPDDEIARITSISRPTYYRNKAAVKKYGFKGLEKKSTAPKRKRVSKIPQTTRDLVLKIRRINPTYGKEKITIILKRDHGITISESSTGRILKSFFQRGIVQKSLSAPRKRRDRNFNKTHAKAWNYKEYAEMIIGERIQIDHMSVTKNGVFVKHFQAWDRKSKFIHAQIYSNAKATSARKFLIELIKISPIPILSIQVDGGSEFMAEFETACAGLNIPLIVLPPSKPKYNGGVERGNRIFKEEFYYNKLIKADSIGGIRAELKYAIKKYNQYRPHKNLSGLTPMQYINNNIKVVKESHML